MIKKKVELLAPAGNFTCFVAAINAGADAVYIGGSRYGARAYADNFSEEEIVKAIKYAHIHGRKVYLTVNTLVKNPELDGLVNYMIPYYEAGLDGVIIQDFGVFEILKKHFPGMELHASTQMTLTGVNGARFLKEQGACRIVPARELSLEEIRDIKEQVDIEIEAFIHGAMCYAYSGQCLFSSILGGRSGNRGRCAGPCRLPYTAVCNGKKQGDTRQEQYPLSLKDMYTLRCVPELIEAGIDSFKIEGRMKSPEYVAGVTSVYRKYIDQYYEFPSKKYEISKEDERLVTGLYVRSGLQDGYYFKHNGKDMITLKEPGYAGTDEQLVEKIRQQYVLGKKQKSVVAKAVIKAGEPAAFMIASDRNHLEQLIAGHICDGVRLTGITVQQAQNRPMTKEDISRQFQKMGDTNFSIEHLTVEMEGDVFVPVKFLNELRRNTVAAYEEQLLNERTRHYKQVEIQHKESDLHFTCQQRIWSCLVSNKEQLQEAFHQEKIQRIYIDADLLTCNTSVDRIYVNEINSSKELFIALPYILRKRSYQYLSSYQELLNTKKNNGDDLFTGVLVRNLEELAWLKDIGYDGRMIGDANVYIWNHESIAFYKKFLQGMTLPIELNRKEKRHVIKDAQQNDLEVEEIVYGRIPMMYSSNCTKKTYDLCDGKACFDEIIDRYRNHFPIYHNCKHCYNVIYNSVPLSLQQYVGEMDKVNCVRLEFTNETVDEMKKIIECFVNDKTLSIPDKKQNVNSSYTTGHFKRGVE